MSATDSANLQDLHDYVLANMDPAGFVQGFGIGITVLFGIYLCGLIFHVWDKTDRDL